MTHHPIQPKRPPRGDPPTGGGTGARDPYTIPRKRLDQADPLLDRVYRIAEDLADLTDRGRAAQRARRAGRRICNLIDQVDEMLGLDNAD